MYLPLLILSSFGFSASAGMIQIFPIFDAHSIRPSMQRVLIVWDQCPTSQMPLLLSCIRPYSLLPENAKRHCRYRVSKTPNSQKTADAAFRPGRNWDFRTPAALLHIRQKDYNPPLAQNQSFLVFQYLFDSMAFECYFVFVIISVIVFSLFKKQVHISFQLIPITKLTLYSNSLNVSAI